MCSGPPEKGAERARKFPDAVSTHVGYGEDWQKIFGVPVEIRTSGGDPREPRTSWVRLKG